MTGLRSWSAAMVPLAGLALGSALTRPQTPNTRFQFTTWHDPLQGNRTLRVKYNPLRCPHPYFVVRAIGAELADAPMRQADDPLVFAGTFPSHLNGTYMIDVTLLTCSDNRALRHPNPRYYNAGTLYSENCALPVPEVVARYPVVFTADKQQEKKERSGAWVLRPGFSPPVGHDIDIRYQTKECLASSDIKHKQFPPECQYSAANSYTYEAVGQAEAIARTKEYPKTHDGALPTYCFVGASHGRDVGAAFAAVANSTLATMHYLRATHLRAIPNLLKALHAGDVHDTHTGVRVTHCTNFILHIGQWDLGIPEGKWTPHDTWRNHAKLTCSTLNTALKNGTIGSARVLTINYIPMMAWMLNCPPNDWRQPWVIDVYNDMLKSECTKNGIQVVDTNAQVIGPIWDSAWDWCHFNGPGFTALAKFMYGMLA
eukprot:m.464625 g.464625  ORF g.464625 m.464625 type:complete len:428 (+) comp23621_c0_seq1:167-1450(+)